MSYPYLMRDDKFYIPWLADTWPGPNVIPKKQLTTQDIPRMCDDLVSALKSKSNFPLPGFSLRIASHLTGGLARVYKRKADDLLEDCTDVKVRKISEKKYPTYELTNDESTNDGSSDDGSSDDGSTDDGSTDDELPNDTQTSLFSIITQDDDSEYNPHRRQELSQEHTVEEMLEASRSEAQYSTLHADDSVFSKSPDTPSCGGGGVEHDVQPIHEDPQLARQQTEIKTYGRQTIERLTRIPKSQIGDQENVSRRNFNTTDSSLGSTGDNLNKHRFTSQNIYEADSTRRPAPQSINEPDSGRRLTPQSITEPDSTSRLTQQSINEPEPARRVTLQSMNEPEPARRLTQQSMNEPEPARRLPPQTMNEPDSARKLTPQTMDSSHRPEFIYDNLPVTAEESIMLTESEEVVHALDETTSPAAKRTRPSQTNANKENHKSFNERRIESQEPRAIVTHSRTEKRKEATDSTDTSVVPEVGDAQLEDREERNPIQNKIAGSRYWTDLGRSSDPEPVWDDIISPTLRRVRREWGIRGTLMKVLNLQKQVNRPFKFVELLQSVPQIEGYQKVSAARCYASLLELKLCHMVKMDKYPGQTVCNIRCGPNARFYNN